MAEATAPLPGPRSQPPPGEPRWGLGDAAIGYLVGLVASTAVAGAVLAATGRMDQSTDELPLTYVALLQIPLWLGLGGAAVVAARRKGNGVVADLRLRFRLLDAPLGLVAGVATQALVIPWLYLPIFRLFGDDLDVSAPARSLTERATGAGVVLLALVVVAGAPVVEELFYRGLVLRSLERRTGRAVALWVTAAVFAASHFQLLQFPALLVFGAVAGWLAQRTGRLGPAIWAHVGFNAWTVVVLLGAETLAKSVG